MRYKVSASEGNARRGCPHGEDLAGRIGGWVWGVPAAAANITQCLGVVHRAPSRTPLHRAGQMGSSRVSQPQVQSASVLLNSTELTCQGARPPRLLQTVSEMHRPCEIPPLNQHASAQGSQNSLNSPSHQTTPFTPLASGDNPLKTARNPKELLLAVAMQKENHNWGWEGAGKMGLALCIRI